MLGKNIGRREHKNRFVCLQPCPYLFPVNLSVHTNNLYKTTASLFLHILCFFYSQHTTCIMITTIINITHPLRYIQTKHIFFSVWYKINVHIFWYFPLSFFFIISLFSKKEKQRKIAVIYKSQNKKSKHSPHQGCCFFFFPFFSYRLNSADACSLINMFDFFFVLNFIYMWPWVVQVETDSQICCVTNGWKVWQEICLKWPQKWREDCLHVYTDSLISICPVQVFELSSARQEWHFASC